MCCLQETRNRDSFWISGRNLKLGNYNLELETNSVKKRVGIYIQKDIDFLRRKDLEKPDLHVVFFGICPPPGLLPVLGPYEQYMTPTLDAALLISY